jgi:hypothetical protein
MQRGISNKASTEPAILFFSMGLFFNGHKTNIKSIGHMLIQPLLQLIQPLLYLKLKKARFSPFWVISARNTT